MKIVVAGHGNFASGIKSTIKLLAGTLPDIDYVDFTEEMSEDELRVLLRKIVEIDNNIVFFCDLFGGTPYKVSVMLKQEFPSVEIVAGGNIGSLLEQALTGINKFATTEELAKKLVSSSIENTKRYQKYIFDNNEDTDGI